MSEQCVSALVSVWKGLLSAACVLLHFLACGDNPSSKASSSPGLLPPAILCHSLHLKESGDEQEKEVSMFLELIHRTGCG